MMRLDQDFSYVVNCVPKPPTEFDLIQQTAGISIHEMYKTFNMGVGFVVYAPADYQDEIVKIANRASIQAWNMGRVEAGPRSVHIKPLDIEWTGAELGVR